MSVISVDLDRLERESASFAALGRTLQDYNETVNGISLKLSMNILAQKRVDLLLREVHDQILSEAAKMKTLGDALAQIVRDYKATETKLADLCDAKRSLQA